MVIYKKGKLNLLTPMLVGMIMLVFSAAPVRGYLEYKKTNTDAVPVSRVQGSLSKLDNLEKKDAGEIKVPALGEVSVVKNTTVVSSASTAVASACANTPEAGYANYISICGRVIPLSFNAGQTRNVSPPAGTALKQMGYNFIFGHNSYDVFGGLYASLQAGDPMVVSINGVKTTYHFVYYRQNASASVIDAEFLPAEGSGTMALMTCAPWVVDGAADNSRLGFVFTK